MKKRWIPKIHCKSIWRRASVFRKYEGVGKGIEPITEALTAFASAIGNITIPSEIISTLEVVGEVCTNFTINTEKYMNQEKYKSVFNSTFSTSTESLSIEVRADDNNFADAA